MCGIVGITGARHASSLLLDALEKLEYRGYDSAGISTVHNGRIALCKTEGRIENLRGKTEDGILLPGTCGIGHTRWATHGPPTDSNAHPHMSNDGKFSVVHNGIIENYLPLREELTAQGFRFLSDTDTEVAVHLLELYYEGDLRQAVMKTIARLQGSYALGILCTDYPDTLFAVREASPLILGIGVDTNYFASDVTALVPYTRNVIHLEDGEFAALTPASLHVYDCAGRQVEKQVSRITWSVEAAEKGGCDHYMMKEILEQPHAVQSAIAPRIDNGILRREEFGFTADELKGVRHIIITACGSAYYAGCAARHSLQALCGIPVTVEYASELRYSNIPMDKHMLLIAVSQSGETADTIAALEACKTRGVRSLAVVNVVDSTLARLADHTMYTWAGPEIAVATTKGYTTQLAVLYLFAVYAAQAMGRLSHSDAARLFQDLELLPKAIQGALDMNPTLPKLAEKYSDGPSVFFMGRGTDYAAALEGALKLKEVSYVHAEAYAAGELKHGTMALMDRGQSVIALCCGDNVREKTLNNIIEVKARGARVLAIATKGNHEIVSCCDDVLFVPKTEGLFSPAVEVIPLQLFAYYAAKARGCDIDKPKNLAKSVTVE